MGRMILVPQFPSKMRYQEWWPTEFEKEFKKYYDEVIVLGRIFEDSDKSIPSYGHTFSPIERSIQFELCQISEYMKLDLRADDTLFLCDLSFPGFFANVLYHKKPKHCFAFCHATSRNYLDYFGKNRSSKWMNETAHSKMFEKIYVASKYHQKKLRWNNTLVVALPKAPSNVISKKDVTKNIDIISVNRPTLQKVSKKLEKEAEDFSGVKIKRLQCQSWEEYCTYLTASKILMISSKEDTFNYTILDAVECGCIPIAPNKLCFPEILPREYLYNDAHEASQIIGSILAGKLKVPKIINQNLIDTFFENIVSGMCYHGS